MPGAEFPGQSCRSFNYDLLRKDSSLVIESLALTTPLSILASQGIKKDLLEQNKSIVPIEET